MRSQPETAVDRDGLAAMPKVELHVHLEGSIRPETVLKLAEKNGVALPASDLPALRDWFTFQDFPHFVEVYLAVSSCIRAADDIELIAREFLEGQAAQNILHSEVTYTAVTMHKHMGIPFDEQIDALRRAIRYGKEELGVSMRLILDIVRGHEVERAVQVAEWAVASQDVVCALGLAGEERLGTVAYAPAFEVAKKGGLPVVAHAGETCGPETIWDCLRLADSRRIGHGVRCLEDRELVDHLREKQIPLEVCPSSNVCLGVFPTLEEHPFKRLMDEGLYVTLNSDDPPFFNTTLTDEYVRVSETFGLSERDCRDLVTRAAHVALLPEKERKALVEAVA